MNIVKTEQALYPHNLPRELFIKSLTHFHELLGDREFWNSALEQRNKNISALFQDFIRTVHPDIDSDATLLKSALQEYALRENWTAFKPAIWKRNYNQERGTVK